MSNVSSSNGETLHIQQAATIKNVVITNESGGALGLSIFRFRDTGGRRFLRLVALDDVTAQIALSGMAFPDGFTVVPDTNLNYYLIEYEVINANPNKSKEQQ